MLCWPDNEDAHYSFYRQAHHPPSTFGNFLAINARQALHTPYIADSGMQVACYSQKDPKI